MSNRLPVLAAEIKAAHAGIKQHAQIAAQHAIDAGHALLEAKGLLKHGTWLPWLREHCQISERSAQLYMKIAELGLRSETVADLGLKGASRAIVARYDPYAKHDGDAKREMHLYMLLMSRDGWSVENAQNYVDRLARIGFPNIEDWLIGEGVPHRRLCGLGEIPATHIDQWGAFKREHETKTLDEIFALLSVQAEQEPPPDPKKTKARRAAMRRALAGAPQ